MPFFFFPFHTRAKTKVSKTKRGGGQTPKVTNAFLRQIRNILENLFLPKVLYVTKGCLKNLARAKNEMRAQNRKISIFGAINFTPPPPPFL